MVTDREFLQFINGLLVGVTQYVDDQTAVDHPAITQLLADQMAAHINARARREAQTDEQLDD